MEPIEKQDESRYYRLTGKATIAQTNEFTLVLLHDDEVNPRRETLVFKSPLKQAPNPGAGHILANKSVDILASFNSFWFDDTMKKGFLLPKADKTLVTLFGDLELPTDETEKRMNPIVPIKKTKASETTAKK